MGSSKLVCSSCSAVQPLTTAYRCGQCGDSLAVQYEYEAIFRTAPFGRNAEQHAAKGIWGYKDLLPFGADLKRTVTLGEGNTPLIRTNRLGRRLNHDGIYLKNETLNPTLSFKDRALAVALSVALHFEMEAVVSASTGNTGVSAAAYSAKAGMPCTLYVPESTPAGKLTAMEFYGAKLNKVDGTFSDAYLLADQAASERSWFNLTSTFLNPYALEGHKTIAYEMFSQMEVPDWILVPIGAGPLLVSIYRGFQEMGMAGVVNKIPMMVGVQAEGCAPIVNAFINNRAVTPWGRPETISSAIADPLETYPNDGTRTLHTIRKSGGLAISVSDADTLLCQKMLAELEGIWVENASATAVSAVKELIANGTVKKDETAVVVLTGHGSKDSKAK